jgi:hypothetical protein
MPALTRAYTAWREASVERLVELFQTMAALVVGSSERMARQISLRWASHGASLKLK